MPEDVIWSLWTLEADAQAALDAIWVAMMRAKAAENGGTLLDITSGNTVVASTLTDEEIADTAKYPLMGYKAQTLNKTSGFTTAHSLLYVLGAGAHIDEFGFPTQSLSLDAVTPDCICRWVSDWAEAPV